MTLGNLVVNLTANTSQFAGGMNKSKGLVSSFASSAKRWLAGVAASVVTTAAAWVSYSTAVAAVSAATEQLASERKLAAVLKSTGSTLLPENIKQFAELRQQLTNFGDEATINAAAILATFKSVSNEAFLPTLQAAQDMSAVLGTDLKSSVLQLGKALENPAIGLTYLRRSGVSFTDSQGELIKSLQSSGRLLEAQQVILKEVRSQFGGASEATADFFTQLRNIAGDNLEEVGRIIIDIANTLNNEFDFLGMARDTAEWMSNLRESTSMVDSISRSLSSAAKSMEMLAGIRISDDNGQGGLVSFFERLAMTFELLEKLIERDINKVREFLGMLSVAEERQRKLLPAGPNAPPAAAQAQALFSSPDISLDIQKQRENNRRFVAGMLGQNLAMAAGALVRGFSSSNKLVDFSKPARGASAAKEFAPAAEKGSLEAYREIIRAQKPDEQLKVMNKIEENTRKPALINSGQESKTIESFK